MEASVNQADLVLEGGGVKGVGLVGAVLRLMDAGYRFTRVAGTSAGAIVAALLASGASAEQLRQVMERLDYRKVPDRAPPPIPGVSEGVSLLRHAGAYEGDYIHEFLREELGRLGVETFADLRREHDEGADPGLERFQQYKLVVMATDITNGRLLRLPWDYHLLGLEPDSRPVADAVRASISIPLYFEPVTIRNGTGEPVTLVDGGVLSNFPIEAFDRTDGAEPRWPTFGVRIIPDLPAGDAQLFPLAALPLLPPIRLLERVTATAIAGHDQTYLERPCVRRRTVRVDTGGVGIIEFDAPPEKLDAVRIKGEEAADRFLAEWDWERYKQNCVRRSP